MVNEAEQALLDQTANKIITKFTEFGRFRPDFANEIQADTLPVYFSFDNTIYFNPSGDSVILPAEDHPVIIEELFDLLESSEIFSTPQREVIRFIKDLSIEFARSKHDLLLCPEHTLYLSDYYNDLSRVCLNFRNWNDECISSYPESFLLAFNCYQSIIPVISQLNKVIKDKLAEEIKNLNTYLVSPDLQSNVFFSAFNAISAYFSTLK